MAGLSETSRLLDQRARQLSQEREDWRERVRTLSLPSFFPPSPILFLQ